MFGYKIDRNVLSNDKYKQQAQMKINKFVSWVWYEKKKLITKKVCKLNDEVNWMKKVERGIQGGNSHLTCNFVASSIWGIEGKSFSPHW